MLVTHQTQFLPLADQVVILSHGRVVARGTYAEVRELACDLPEASFLTDLADTSSDLEALLGSTEDDAGRAAETAQTVALGRSELLVGDVTKNAAGSKLVQEEERATGSVSWAVHLQYLHAAGGVGFGLVLLLGCCWERAVMVSTDYWLSLWVNPYGARLVRIDRPQSEFDFWIPIYFGCVVLAGISVFARSLFMGGTARGSPTRSTLLCAPVHCPALETALLLRPSPLPSLATLLSAVPCKFIATVVMGLRAARVLYKELAASVIASPMVFFETTPSGRIVNRFTSDTEQMDFQLLMMLSQWINCISTGVVLGSPIVDHASHHHNLQMQCCILRSRAHAL